MPTRPVEHAAQQGTRTHARRRTRPQPRMPSTAGYMAVAGGLALALFWLIWWLLRTDGEEAPWLPAGLTAGFVILAAAAAREVVMRRAWARYTREMDLVMGAADTPRSSVKAASSPTAKWSNMQAQVAALRGLQQRLAELDSANTTPEAHHEAYKLCEQYLTSTEDVLRSQGGPAEMRAALRSGQERVRAFQRKHMLAWARGETTRLTHEAQRRVRVSDRIETAQRALEVLEEAMRAYPEEYELHDSSLAVRNFIASVKVGQWVEMAERAAFRGLYERAVARYRDALFYLSRADMGEDARAEAATRIQREIELLRARAHTTDLEANSASDSMRSRAAARRDGEGPPDLSAEEEVLG